MIEFDLYPVYTTTLTLEKLEFDIHYHVYSHNNSVTIDGVYLKGDKRNLLDIIGNGLFDLIVMTLEQRTYQQLTQDRAPEGYIETY